MPGRVRLPDVGLPIQCLFGQICDGDPRLEGFPPGDLDGMLERNMIRVAVPYGLVTPFLPRGSTERISGA
ncbi:hypothetical protein [Thiocapsa bogorovii]|uniref:hypothetical protein n=1 Tax=Thiocapsa bogorovii TaxID=521689 RepID=UPI001E2FD83D|nr:hypothetical protein [Thiocapsa bogorovii]UHD16618.1 hypothetical protein LT988_00690 [Thiocapsa bogorovii]